MFFKILLHIMWFICFFLFLSIPDIICGFFKSIPKLFQKKYFEFFGAIFGICFIVFFFYITYLFDVYLNGVPEPRTIGEVVSSTSDSLNEFSYGLIILSITMIVITAIAYFTRKKDKKIKK